MESLGTWELEVFFSRWDLPILQCEAPKIAFSWFITPISMVYGTYNALVTGANLNQLITWGPHIVVMAHTLEFIMGD